jgi:hypothetical protein
MITFLDFWQHSSDLLLVKEINRLVPDAPGTECLLFEPAKMSKNLVTLQTRQDSQQQKTGHNRTTPKGDRSVSIF